MKNALILFSLFIASVSFGQKLKFKIEGQADTTVHLVKYYGKNLFYADTAQIKKGIVEFDGSKQKPGMLALFLPDKSMLEFVYNNEDVSIEAQYPQLMNSAKVKKSEENTIFFKYVDFIGNERQKTQALSMKLQSFDKKSEEYKNLQKEIDGASEKVRKYQLALIEQNPNLLVSKIVKMSMDIQVPDSITELSKKEGNSNLAFIYYRDHYWDNVDFSDDRLVNTSIFHGKLEKYFSKDLMIQHWDTVIHYAFDLCDQLDPKSRTFQYCVSWITSTYEKSNIMGLDKVFVRMGEKYYCSKNENGESPAYWMSESQIEKLCDRVNDLQYTVLGIQPPNIILPDVNNKWRDFKSLPSEYTILYFWDPECGHCKKVTPKLQTLYEKKFKDRNIEVFAVGKAVGEDYAKWKAFIKKNNLEFINVAVTDSIYNIAMEDARRLVPKYTTLESLNYQKTYDIYSTPRVFILDKDKKTIAKGLTISQLEEMLDRLQGKSDLEKIFPIEEEPADEKIH